MVDRDPGPTRPSPQPTPPVYAIRGAKIVTGAGAAIDKGNLVMRNGLIADVGAAAAIPAEAAVVDGSNLTVYPGLIDMTRRSRVVRRAARLPSPPADGARAGGEQRRQGHVVLANIEVAR